PDHLYLDDTLLADVPANELSYRAARSEVSPGEGSTDHDQWRRGCGTGIRKLAPVDQGDAHGREIAMTDGAKMRSQWIGAHLLQRPPWRHEGAQVDFLRDENTGPGEARGLHLRVCPEPRQYGFDSVGLPADRVIGGEHELKSEGVGRIVTFLNGI